MKKIVKIQENDKPDKVAWKFIHALQSLGLHVKEINELEYEIIYNNNKLDQLNPMKTKTMKV